MFFDLSVKKCQHLLETAKDVAAKAHNFRQIPTKPSYMTTWACNHEVGVVDIETQTPVYEIVRCAPRDHGKLGLRD